MSDFESEYVFYIDDVSDDSFTCENGEDWNEMENLILKMNPFWQ